MTIRTNSREAILESAENLIAGRGVKQFSFEALAKEANISRGGILYHFASKDALIQAMIERLIMRFEELLDDQIANDPDAHGRFTRAFARTTFQMDSKTSATFSAIIAAVAYDPHLLDPLRDRWQKWQERSEAELSKPVAAVVQMASHALWLNGIFGMSHYSVDEQNDIVDILEKLTRQ